MTINISNFSSLFSGQKLGAKELASTWKTLTDANKLRGVDNRNLDPSQQLEVSTKLFEGDKAAKLLWRHYSPLVMAVTKRAKSQLNAADPTALGINHIPRLLGLIDPDILLAAGSLELYRTIRSITDVDAATKDLLATQIRRNVNSRIKGIITSEAKQPGSHFKAILDIQLELADTTEKIDAAKKANRDISESVVLQRIRHSGKQQLLAQKVGVDLHVVREQLFLLGLMDLTAPETGISDPTKATKSKRSKPQTSKRKAPAKRAPQPKTRKSIRIVETKPEDISESLQDFLTKRAENARRPPTQ